MKLYFRDNFFSSGETEILNEKNEPVGRIDLKSAFGSSIDVYGQRGNLLCSGSFPFFSNKWEVMRSDGESLGVLRYRLSFFNKKYTYESYKHGSFEITSPAFSREYEITKESGRQVAHFSLVSGWFSSGAYLLDNQSEVLDSYELTAVIMGMNAIQKRHRSS